MTLPSLEFRNVSKAFPGVVALDDVSFAVASGEVRALLGENGAGKSTLLKILAGEYLPDKGHLDVAGRPTVFATPRESQAAGIAIIHQELHLVPDLSVTENLLLGRMPTRRGFIDRNVARTMARRILEKLGEDIDLDVKVRSLSIGKRQMIEIGKALLRDARIIAFDEPTASLSARETDTLLRIVGELKTEGRAILYVSHRLEEIFTVCDSITVLRDGVQVGNYPDKRTVNRDELITAMVGRRITDIFGYCARSAGSVSVSIDALQGPGLRQPLSLQAREGEILGFFGLVGAGRSELFRLLYGAVPATSGSIRIFANELASAGPRDAIASGLALCPEDRKDEGIVPLATVAENIVLARRNLRGTARVLVDRADEARHSADLIALMHIKTASSATAIAALSGGNQQKAIIARWLAADARILLLDEPTRGIDIGARSEIYAHIYALAREGRTILFASSDIHEVIGISDRIVVMREGILAGEIAHADATPEQLLRLALPDGASDAPTRSRE